MSTIEPDGEVPIGDVIAPDEASTITDVTASATTPPITNVPQTPKVVSALRGRWLALVGVILFAVSLPLAWSDTAGVPQNPSTLIFNYIIDGYSWRQGLVIFSYSITNMLVITVLGAIAVSGLLASALCFQRTRDAFARRAIQGLSVWAVIATSFSVILLYLGWQAAQIFSEYPLQYHAASWRPDIGLGLALLALIITWYAISRLAFEWHNGDYRATPSVAQPTHRWSIGIALIASGFVIWGVGYFWFYWVEGPQCTRFMSVAMPPCWPRLKAIDMLGLFFSNLHYQILQITDFAGVFLLVAVAVMALGCIAVWRNGATRTGTYWLIAALTLPTLMTILSSIGAVHTLAASQATLGLGMPLACAALLIGWIGMITVWREDPAPAQLSVA